MPMNVNMLASTSKKCMTGLTDNSYQFVVKSSLDNQDKR